VAKDCKAANKTGHKSRHGSTAAHFSYVDRHMMSYSILPMCSLNLMKVTVKAVIFKKLFKLRSRPDIRNVEYFKLLKSGTL